MGRWATTISLLRTAYNPDSAPAFGHVWKLAYHFSSPTRPRLQVFMDDEAARLGEWSTYGAPEDKADTLSFSGLGDVQPVRLDGSNFTVSFVTLATQLVDYPRGGPEQEPVFGFAIERLR